MRLIQYIHFCITLESGRCISLDYGLKSVTGGVFLAGTLGCFFSGHPVFIKQFNYFLQYQTKKIREIILNFLLQIKLFHKQPDQLETDLVKGYTIISMYIIV